MKFKGLLQGENFIINVLHRKEEEERVRGDSDFKLANKWTFGERAVYSQHQYEYEKEFKNPAM